jgi:hypothetical protein
MANTSVSGSLQQKKREEQTPIPTVHKLQLVSLRPLFSLQHDENSAPMLDKIR